jgi:hypothetical protein
MAAREAVRAGRARPAVPAGAAATVAEPLVERVLALQRRAGNRATGATLERRLARQVVTIGEVTIEGAPWTDEQSKAIQRELRRLRLYAKGIDGIIGFFTEQGLTEAFGGHEWEALAADAIIDRLHAAKRPAGGGGHSLRYAELYQDGVLDVTLGLGYLEGMVSYLNDLVSGTGQALQAMGFKEDRERALAALARAGRSVASDAIGTFWVKPAAFTYAPPAGSARSVDVVVRIIANPGGDRGGAALGAFHDAMTQGDVAYYAGHGRYGSGPDFDPNFGSFTLKDSGGNVQQVIDDYDVLEKALAREGDPWTVFERRVKNGTLVVQITNAGNLWLNARNAHSNEFGGKLIYWALQQSGTPETGSGGALGRGASSSGRNYRVMVFDGCRTQDYDASLRATPGFGTRDADIIETTRTTGFKGEVSTFLAFLGDLMAQRSAEGTIADMDVQMRLHEVGYSGGPYKFAGVGDNPGN